LFVYHWSQVDIVNNSGDGKWVDPKIVPECLLSRLTTCSLRNYSRINFELQFAKYIMKNSKVLNTMTIQVAKSVESNIKFQMLTELSSCPINSAACELLVIWNWWSMHHGVVRSLNYVKLEMLDIMSLA
jgi:hypothetical protein